LSLWKKIFRRGRGDRSIARLREKLDRFRELVEKNNEVLELIADAGEKLGGEYIFDFQYLKTLDRQLAGAMRGIVGSLNVITGDRYPALVTTLDAIERDIQAVLESRMVTPESDLAIPMNRVGEDLVESVGEKMARLGEISQRLGCSVPDGFVISAYACQLFLKELAIDRSIEAWTQRPESIADEFLAQQASDFRERILKADLPKGLARAIRGGLTGLKKKGTCHQLAVRSSALGEDGEVNYAGQYRTVLGVSPDRVASAYREVLASLFSPEVMRYRMHFGLHPAHGLMAVGCLCLIEARASGVVYTLDPAAPQRNVLVGAAARGLGKTVVEGSAAADRFEMSRESPHQLLSLSIARKEEALVAVPDQGLERAPLSGNEQSDPAVTEQLLRELASTAMQIEKYMKCAQDIEWAVDPDGRLFILQTRPLRLSPAKVSFDHDMTEVSSKYETVLKNQGTVACRGIGSGRVHIVGIDDDMDNPPRGVVLVARTSTPRLASAMMGANAVLTDIGTATGHLAAIARELRVPTIVDMQIATEVLRDAGEVTVDAEENIVYLGRVDELLHHQLLRSSSYEDTFEFRMLRKMLRKIAPLNLKDPSLPGFSPKGCITYHDIIRFAHEKAVDELNSGHWVRPSRRSQYVRRLDLDVPLDLIVIDLGGGLVRGKEGVPLSGEDIASEPLRAILEGLTTEGVWDTGPADMDLDGFMSSATRSASLTGPLAPRPQQNLAIVSDHYLNLILRLGYHFNIVDCNLSETRNDNFIYFRFAGGVTEQARRSRRATLLKKILEKQDFVVEGRGDLVIGRIKKISHEAMVEHLRMIGRLIGFSRQLDIFLRSDNLVDRYANDFLEGRYNLFTD
jgi:pyruvate, water dikinase